MLKFVSVLSFMGRSSYSDTPYSDSSEFLFPNCWLRLGTQLRCELTYLGKPENRVTISQICAVYKQEICAKHIQNMPKYAPTMSENMREYAGNM